MYIVFLGTLTILVSTVLSSLPAGDTDRIQQHFHVTIEPQLVLPISVFLAGYVLGPFFFAPISESYGRRYVFLATYTAMTIFTLATALASALTKIEVRKDIAMTGEITLRGKVLPIGGLKEKLLAAHRAGIVEAVLPAENRKDYTDLPQLIKDSMKLHFVEQMDEVLQIALDGKLPELAEEQPAALESAKLPAMPPPATTGAPAQPHQ